jgi:hypothetical protein
VKFKGPRRLNRTRCGVPPDNHETYPDGEGVWQCLNGSCPFIGDQWDATAHVVANQFTYTKSMALEAPL